MEPRRLLPPLLAIVAVSALWIWSPWSDGAVVPDDGDAAVNRAMETAGMSGDSTPPAADDPQPAGVARTTIDSNRSLADGASGADFDGLIGRFSCPGERFNWPVELTWYPKYGGAGGDRETARTEADGSFRMDGEVYAGGSVHFPQEYEVVRVEGAIDATIDNRSVKFRDIDGPLILHAELRDAAIGRLLDGDTPAPGVLLSFRWELSSETETSTGSGKTNAAGHFRIPLSATAEPSGLRLRFADWRTGAVETFHIDGESLPADRDLGDFRLDPGRAVTLLLHEPDGSAVDGATIEQAGIIPAPVSGLDGRVSLPCLERGERKVTVVAVGYVPKTVLIPADFAGELEVEVFPTTILEMSLIPADGTRGSDYQYRYTSDSGIGVEGDWFHRSLRPYGASRGSGTQEGGWAWSWQARDDVPQFLSGLPIGRPLTIRIAWRGLELESRILEPFREGERRRIEFRPTIPYDLVSVRAVDESGDPLLGVALAGVQSSERGGATSYPIRPETDGSWLVAGEPIPWYSNAFEKAGYLPRKIPGTCPSEVVMRPAHALAVLLKAPDESAILERTKVKVTYLDVDGREIETTVPWAMDKEFRFPRVPASQVSVRVQAYGYEDQELIHDVRTGDLVVRMQPAPPR